MMDGIIDFHSHILPGVDDGCKTVDEAIALLGMAAEQGISRMVATPHFYPRHDTPERFLKRRAEAEARLRDKLQTHSGLPEVLIGAEVHYFNGISNSEAIAELTIDKKSCILIEMPMSPWSDAMYRELEGLHSKQGLLPIIAHVDRYIGRFRTFGIPERLAQLPVLVQANGDFFLKRSTAGMALRMLKKNRIHLLGSDCHNLSSRHVNLGQTLERIQNRLGEDPVEEILRWQRYALRDE